MPDSSSVELIARLASEQRGEQRAACEEVLTRIGSEPEIRRALLDLLREGTRRARFGAAFVLFRSEAPSLRLLPALLESLELDDGDLRWSAAHMLATLGRMQGEVLPVLLHETQKSESPLRRRMGLYVLRELAPERSETCATFVAALDDPDPDVRRAALSSLGKLTEPDRACLDRALRALDADPDPRMRRIAAVVVPDVLSEDPESRRIARESLERASGAEDPSLARAATASLARIQN